MQQSIQNCMHSSFICLSPQFAHPHSSKLTSREVCTTTGAMLSEAKTLLPQEWHVKRYPKWKIDQVCVFMCSGLEMYCFVQITQ